MVFTVTLVADAIIFEASLTFIGAGIAEPTPTWGNILADARAAHDVEIAFARRRSHRILAFESRDRARARGRALQLQPVQFRAITRTREAETSPMTEPA